jgi:hypothetical protein
MSKVSSMNKVKRNACRILVGRAERKGPLGRPGCGWVDNIKMELGRDSKRWYVWLKTGMSGEPSANTVMNLWLP